MYCSARLKYDRKGNFGYFKMKLPYSKLYMVYPFKTKCSRAAMYTESAHTIIRDFRRTVEYDMELAILVFVTLRCNLCIATINVCNSAK